MRQREGPGCCSLQKLIPPWIPVHPTFHGVIKSHCLAVCISFFFFFNIFIDYVITVVPFPPLLHSILPTPSLPHSPPIVHVHGSYLQVLWLLHFLHYSYPPPVYFLPTIYAIYSLYLSPLSPPPNPLLITLHVISISMVLFQLFAQFYFVFVLGVVVYNCEFAVIFTVPIFYLLFLR